jgi:hypothetical protein
MKMCRNHFDIVIKPTTKCSECAFKKETRPCLWMKLLSFKVTFDCGGVITPSLSDIFKL